METREWERDICEISSLEREGEKEIVEGEDEQAYSSEEKDVREDCMRVRGFIGRETNFASN